MFDSKNPENPGDLFNTWFAEAKESEINDPNGMAVASLGADGMPSIRMVLSGSRV